MKKRLCKSSSDSKICGVCGGLGVYLNLDSTVIRLVWGLVTVCSCGTGIIAYIVAALIMPDDEIIQ